MKSFKLILRLSILGVIVISTLVGNIYAQGGMTVQFTKDNNIDRPGRDYKNFDLPRPDVNLCIQECQKDPNCKAYTYVRPGAQGKNARCWLKNDTPNPIANNNCISE